MSEETRFSEQITACQTAIDSIVSSIFDSETANDALFRPYDFKVFQNSLSTIQSSFTIDVEQYRLSVPQDTNDDEKESIQKQVDVFNDGLDSRALDFVLSNAFIKTVESYTDAIISSHKREDPKVTLGGVQVPESNVIYYSKISILLDLLVFLGTENSSYKKIFHRLTAYVSETLFIISTKELEVFWYYMESRLNLINGTIFNRAVTSDRIAILEVCNPLTDKFHSTDSYKKDSFNEGLQSRIRVFVNKLLGAEDNTGLNKYFSVSGRGVPEMALVKRRDNQLYDIIDCFKAIRDPHSYLRPARIKSFRDMSNTFSRVYERLMKLEIDYLKQHPREVYVVKPPRSESEMEYLKSKYSNKEYFPELYWLSVFNKNPQTLEKDIKDDQDFTHDLLNNNKLREVVLVQIFFISMFFAEASSYAKKQLLKNLPPKTKHLVDDTAHEPTSKTFYALRSNIVKELRYADSSFSFLLQNIVAVERHWWSWLLYNKDPKTGAPLLSNRKLSDEELAASEAKFGGLFPVKTKRYFNIYVTPQLSRRMKAVRGLDNVNIKEWGLSDDNSMQVEQTDPDLKNVRLWKQYRQKRQHNWIDFGTALTPEVVASVYDEPAVKKSKAEDEAGTEVSTEV
ncbi:hypothetical protein PSN45_001077 [Yamadazyma tenuis]|uniref:Uncharacterized protein n=1 Tax=Candida tenuis (strain ATCC 10573 / BCRC 21748 / CBS 615 / JCM 9827 / NBRC 10315 / NRRL Y-1498 / VKM Y-70) TaxID=590646 RepID=G3B843_CANTC|nr:uncharacterized protein CANTEDRAFT_136277 [Yamadazyma tenuis ATCC 10573]EGV62344.1 hypothetical protein CANTEDRAFT_136277 [Yamadazyma tenuis ATCC 10573]WEJ93609.1 hypothetical protein PSN45_001077 [Yamadazyma tenuis]